jgi:hypothetical protein
MQVIHGVQIISQLVEQPNNLITTSSGWILDFSSP